MDAAKNESDLACLVHGSIRQFVLGNVYARGKFMER